MTEYMTEQEQIELLKTWIKQYSLFIIMGVCIAAAGIWGWQYWQNRQNKTLYHASIIFDKMLAMRAQTNAEATLSQATRLFNRYPQTVYGQLAALMLARVDINKKNYAEAEKNLTWVINHSKVSSLRQIARIRLARLQLMLNKPDDALALLKKTDNTAFAGLTNEVRGDIYLALKKPDEARAAYEKALNELPNGEVVRPLLQMKYDNLATLGSVNIR